MEKKICEVKKNWEEFAEKDPLWSILPLPDKKNNRWKKEELFETGRKEIELVMEYVDSLNRKFVRGRALDFGCGVGRLTQALCDYFDHCVGVDISLQMLRLAEQYNSKREHCQYVLNCAADLAIFKDDTFDFIYSNIVFQHLPPELTLGYIKEFIRILKKGGIIVFQITTGITGFRNRLRRFLNQIIPLGLRRLYKKLRYQTWAIKDMYIIKEDVLNDFITSNRGYIIDIVDDDSSMPRYRGKRYCITKR